MLVDSCSSDSVVHVVLVAPVASVAAVAVAVAAFVVIAVLDGFESHHVQYDIMIDLLTTMSLSWVLFQFVS